MGPEALELVASNPGDIICFPNSVLNGPRHSQQSNIPYSMSKFIVNVFEIIQVQEKKVIFNPEPPFLS